MTSRRQCDWCTTPRPDRRHKRPVGTVSRRAPPGGHRARAADKGPGASLHGQSRPQWSPPLPKGDKTPSATRGVSGGPLGVGGGGVATCSLARIGSEGPATFGGVRVKDEAPAGRSLPYEFRPRVGQRRPGELRWVGGPMTKRAIAHLRKWLDFYEEAISEPEATAPRDPSRSADASTSEPEPPGGRSLIVRPD